jgi:hypothetical protein
VDSKIKAGWDPVLAYLQEMIEESRDRAPDRRFTRESFVEWGESLPLYDGVTALFRDVRQAASAGSPDTNVAFFLISSGIMPILESTRVRKEFLDAWGCDFAYDESGAIAAVKNVVSFTDKTRYIFQIHKGIFGPASRNDPFLVNKKFRQDEMYVPMHQMVFVGDGFTDIPCFSLLRKHGGYAIGVYDQKDRDKWGRAWGFVENDRVNNLLPVNYTKAGPIRANLRLAVDGIVKAARVREGTYQG